MFPSVFSSRSLAWSLTGLLLTTSLIPTDGAANDYGRLQIAALDAEEATTASPDVPWSDVVRDIQRELRDLGLYTGPLDGLYSADVREAIDRFERLHGSIGEGTPLTDALRSIVSVRDGLKLRRNLDEIRERQTDEALQALRANPETRDLIDGRAGARIGAVPDIANCETAVTVDCLLAAARSDAADVEEINFHDWAMREIILTEIRTGRSSKAVRDRLRQLSDPRLVLVAMREVAEALAQDGRMADGLALAETIPDGENRIRAIAAIAVSAARQGDSKTARDLTQRSIGQLRAKNRLPSRVAIATALASGLAQGGDIDLATDAVRAAREFASPETAALIRGAEVGLLTGTQEGTKGYGDAANALTALVSTSAAAVSQAANAEDRRYRVTTLCNLAVVQARAGKAGAAAETVEKAGAAASRLRKGYSQDYARFNVALTQARIGSFEKSGETLQTIRNDLLRAEGYWRAAEIAGRNPVGSHASRFEQEALAIATALENGFDRSIMLGDMASAAAKAGRESDARRIFDTALQAGRGLDAGWWRARALARLATTLHLVSAAEEKRQEDQR